MLSPQAEIFVMFIPVVMQHATAIILTQVMQTGGIIVEVVALIENLYQGITNKKLCFNPKSYI